MPAVEVAEEWQWIWRAWRRLGLDRPWLGGGLGGLIPARIPWRDIVAWCAFNDLSGDDVAFFDACCFVLDTEFIGYHTAKAQQKPPPWRLDSAGT